MTAMHTRRFRKRLFQFGLATVLGGGGLVCQPVSAAEPVSFSREIAPILQTHCVACHGARKAEGGYRLDTYDELFKEGDSGAPPIVRGEGDTQADPEASELFRRLICDESERMPAEADALDENLSAKIGQWIAEGASFDGKDSSALLTFVMPPKEYAPPPEHYPTTIPITAVALSTTSDEIFVGGYHEVLVWNRAGELVRRIPNLGQRIYAIRNSPDGTLLAIACGEPGRSGEVRLVDVSSGEVRGVAGRSADVALDVAFRPGHSQMAVAAADNLIRIVDTNTLETVKELSSHADWVTALAWNDDGSRLASASRDKSAKLFDAESWQLLVNYQGHGAAVRGVVFLPGSAELMSSSTAGSVHRWQAADGKKTAEVNLGGEGCHLVRGEDFVLAPSSDRRLLKIQIADNKVSHAFQGHSDWVLSVAMKAGDPQIVSGSFNGEVRLWDLAAGSPVQNWIAKP